MRLTVAILLLGVTGISFPAQNSELYGVIVCVSKASVSTTKVSWRTPESLQNATCEMAKHPKKDNISKITVKLPSNGDVIIDAAVLYVVQVTCLLGSNQFKSEELEFLPSSLTEESSCTQSHSPQDSHGVYLCTWQAMSNQALPPTFVWWWSTMQNITSCNLYYQGQGRNMNKEISSIHVSVNGSHHLVASEAWVTCTDLHRKYRSPRVKLKQGYSSSGCKLNAVWLNTDSTTVLPTNSPVQFSGFNVSNIGKGLVLAFSVIVVSIGLAVFTYKRYKWFLHRRAQRLLRVEEDPHEENSLEEFQRMI